MMRSQLCAALDFAKKADVPHECYTYRVGEQWYVVRSGPGYSNTHRVLEFDDSGLAQLLAKERKEESTVA